MHPEGEFRAAGFAHPAGAAPLFASPEIARWGFSVSDFADCADPDRALRALARLEHVEVLGDPSARRRLLAVLGLSTALADFLARHPSAARNLDGEDVLGPGEEAERAGARAAIAEYLSSSMTHSELDPEAIAALRAHYLGRILAIAGRDLTAPDPVAVLPEVAGAISDAVVGTLDAAVQLALQTVPEPDSFRFALMVMGKTGGRELNYSSDVDVTYIVDPAAGTSDTQAIHYGRVVAAALSRIVSQAGSEPALWTLDTNLRPEGAAGEVVRSLDSYLEHYRKWAESWEFQALLKARFGAGDRELAERYIDAIQPLVWEAAHRPDFVEDARAMRRRVEANIDARDAERHIKLGPGGLRDVEFTVQLLQLVHGRTDLSIRQRTTTLAIAALADGTYMARSDAKACDELYRWERCLEHRLQLQRLRRATIFPTQKEELRRIARAMGETTGEALAEKFRHNRIRVRTLHREIFYRPLLPEAAKLSDSDISLDETAALDRLAAIGYRDPHGALGHIRALSSGYSRRAKIAHQLLPVMLGWSADGADPDAGLLAFRVLSEKMGATSWYMRELRDGGPVAQRLCHVLSSSEFLAREIPELPESVAWLGDDAELAPRDPKALARELDAMLERRDTGAQMARAGGLLRRRERLRTGLAQTLQLLGVEAVHAALSEANALAIRAALAGAWGELAAARANAASGQVDAASARAGEGFAVIAMGSLGAGECGYTSDADLLFVFDGEAGLGPEEAKTLATRTMALMSSEGGLEADADLRPEGRNGALARSLDSYAEYYDKWAATWERQALLRARPIAGDQELGQSFLELLEPFRYPREVAPADVTNIRRMKIRIEAERMPGGGEAKLHTKLGPGGLADVEWTAQMLQFQHAGRIETLRVHATADILRTATRRGVLSEDDAEVLLGSWLCAAGMRDALFLATGRATRQSDFVTADPRYLARVGAILGRGGTVTDGRAAREDYIRATRRARTVVERVFYESEGK